MKKLILLSLIATTGFSQTTQEITDSLANRYDETIIYRTSTGFANRAGKINLKKDISEVFSHSPEGMRLYEKYLEPQRKNNWIRGIGLGSSAVGLGGIFFAPPTPTGAYVTVVALGTSMIFNGISIANSTKDIPLVINAMEVRNRDVIFGAKENYPAFQPIVDSLAHRYDQEYFYLNEKDVLTSKRRPISLRLEADEFFERSPEGLQLYKSYKKKNRATMVVLGSGLALYGIGIATGFRQVNRGGSQVLPLACIGGGFVLNIYTLRRLFKYEPIMEKALLIRNRDVIFGRKP